MKSRVVSASVGLAVAFAIVSPPLLAQALPEVVITATRNERSISETLSDVTVIDRRAIEDAGAMTLPELLQSFGGVEMSQNGGAGKVSGLFIRGTRTAQSLILIDGVRMENALSGGGNIEFLPLSMIDRIEIVRGPVSALYGSGAIGGVVQIFTRQGQGPVMPYGSLAYGSQGTSQLRAGVSGAVGPNNSTQFNIGVTSDRTDGYEITRPSSPFYQADNDGNRQTGVQASLRQKLGSNWQFGANLFSTTGKSRYDDTFSTPETAQLHFRSQSMTAFLQGMVTPDWMMQVRFGQSRITNRYDAFVFEPDTRSRTLSWQNDVRLPLGKLIAGVEHLRQTIRGEGVTTGPFPYLGDERTTRSLFAGYELDVGKHLARVQVRRDDIDAVGAQNSGSLSWGYRFQPGWIVRAAAGTSFRAPTFDDLYNFFGSNPNLLAERARGMDLALEHYSGADFFKLIAFANRIRQAIELDAFFIPQNLDSARVNGLSLEARRTFGALNLRGAVTMQHTEGERFDPATGAVVSGRLARRANAYGTLAATWRTGPWRTGIEWIFSGDRVDSNGAKLAGYGVINLNASYAIDKAWQLYARVGNAGDRSYETAFGYNATPRTVLVGVRYAP